MSFVEYEYWRIATGNEAAHHELIRRWFDFVREHHADLFSEWKSTRYFRQVSREGEPTGTYIMLFEFHSLAGGVYSTARKSILPSGTPLCRNRL